MEWSSCAVKFLSTGKIFGGIMVPSRKIFGVLWFQAYNINLGALWFQADNRAQNVKIKNKTPEKWFKMLPSFGAIFEAFWGYWGHQRLLKSVEAIEVIEDHWGHFRPLRSFQTTVRQTSMVNASELTSIKTDFTI